MISVESESFVSAAAEAMSPFPEDPFKWHPDIVRFFPYAQRQLVWDVCGVLWHEFYNPGDRCQSCRYGYSGHEAGLERGRRLLNPRSHDESRKQLQPRKVT